MRPWRRYFCKYEWTAHRKGKTRNLILRTHKDYVTNHVNVELRKLELCYLEELATKELRQSMLMNSFNDYNTDMTKLDLLKCFMMKEQQSKANNITQYLTYYGHPVLKIHVASQHIHTVYEAINALDESKYQHHFPQESISSSFSPKCRRYLVISDDKASRATISQAKTKRTTNNLQQATKPAQTPQPTTKTTTKPKAHLKSPTNSVTPPEKPIRQKVSAPPNPDEARLNTVEEALKTVTSCCQTMK